MSKYHNMPPYHDEDLEASDQEMKEVAKTGASLIFAFLLCIAAIICIIIELIIINL